MDNKEPKKIHDTGFLINWKHKQMEPDSDPIQYEIFRQFQATLIDFNE